MTACLGFSWQYDHGLPNNFGLYAGMSAQHGFSLVVALTLRVYCLGSLCQTVRAHIAPNTAQVVVIPASC
jgi:hypothetical protein